MTADSQSGKDAQPDKGEVRPWTDKNKKLEEKIADEKDELLNEGLVEKRDS
jgi:hypothetical protein